MVEAKTSLAQAVAAVGHVVLSQGAVVADSSQRQVPIGRDGLVFSVAPDTPSAAMLKLKHTLQQHIDLRTSESEISRLSVLCGDKLALLLRSISEQNIDETRIATMFDFLGTDSRFAVQRDGALLVNEGLDEHTLHIARRRVQALRVHAAPIARGELFTCRCDSYEGYFQRDHLFSAVEKALIEVHLNLLARHLRQQSLYRALSNINEMFSREFAGLGAAGAGMANVNEADAAERNFGTLLEAALKDSLTQAYNRNKTGDLLDRLCRAETPFSVILIDIDHFKRVNDCHGHLAGDRVLVGVARRIQSTVRETDVVARWGGEEFLVVTPGSGADEALALGERIRDRIAAEPVADGIAITASLGITLAVRCDTRDTVIARADAALYRSKDAGRNRVSTDIPMRATIEH